MIWPLARGKVDGPAVEGRQSSPVVPAVSLPATVANTSPRARGLTKCSSWYGVGIRVRMSVASRCILKHMAVEGHCLEIASTTRQVVSRSAPRPPYSLGARNANSLALESVQRSLRESALGIVFSGARTDLPGGQ